tara:strand:- start:3334 stop:4161 length:828 start_codon:yes stop_codon:yes gene_type:complete
VGTLFFFADCAGRIKPWRLHDVYSVDVQILNIRQWSKTETRNMDDLQPIMKKELRYYLDNDLRIYERLDPSYTGMNNAILEVDSLTRELVKLVRKMKKTDTIDLDTIPSDTNVTYQKMLRSLSISIQKSQRQYTKEREKLEKGFKKVKKMIIYVDEEAIPLKKHLYTIRYKRELLDPHIDYFNKVLNESLFQDPKSSYSLYVQELSLQLEEYRIKLDKYEQFLSNIDRVARKEAGANVILVGRKDKPMKYISRFTEGKENYLEILKEIRTITESI